MPHLDIQRWNYQTHSYDPYYPPKNRPLIIYTADMNAKTHCANCDAAMTFGDGYTSLELHTSAGIGWPVCENCYNDELDRRREAK